MKQKKTKALQTDSGAKNDEISIPKGLTLKTGAKPKYLLFELDTKTNEYSPSAWGDKEKVRHSLEDTENVKWIKLQQRAKFWANLIVDSFKRFFTIPSK